MTDGIRDFTPGDYDAIAGIQREAYPEYPQSVAEMRHFDERRDPKCLFRRWVLERDDRIVALAYYEQLSGMYHPRRFHMDVQVLPRERGRGHGSALYVQVLEGIRPFDPLTLRGFLREDMKPGLRFLARRGFQEEMRAWESRLEVPSFDPAPYAGLEERLKAQGIVIRTLRDLEHDPQRDEKLYELHWLADQDMPAPEPPTRIPYEVFLGRVLKNPNLLPDGYFLAVDEADGEAGAGGHYVGVSNLWRSREDGELYTGDTGVLRAHRRRGIALALKVRAISFARARGVRIIKTWNESRNRPMLSINERLGYLKQPSWINVVQILREDPGNPLDLRPLDPGDE